MTPAIVLCFALGFAPGVVDEDDSCVPVSRVGDHVLAALAPGGIPHSALPALWADHVEDTMNRRTDDGLAPRATEKE